MSEKVEIKCKLCNGKTIVSNRQWKKIRDNKLGFIDRKRLDYIKKVGYFGAIKLGSEMEQRLMIPIQRHIVAKHKKMFIESASEADKMSEHFEVIGEDELEKHNIKL